MKSWHVELILLAGLALAGLVALLVGSAGLAPGRTIGALWEGVLGNASDPTSTRIVLDIRLPRIVLAMGIGAGMGLTGLAAQTLFRNPLASPYVLGVSNGAAVGAVSAMLLGCKVLGYTAVPLLSIMGGLIVSAAVFALARKSDRLGHSLLLAGIAISAFCSALTAGTIYLAGERLQTMVFWLMGGLSQANWRDVLLVLPASVASLMALILLAPSMNVSLVGERSAGDLGVNIRGLQILLLLIICFTTAVSVAVSGVIGFVGLIVPHLLRMLVGADHRSLVPTSALGGALLLLLADTMARTLAAPTEIPVGIITALVGAPIFLFFLQRRSSREGWS
jgi:iron complex transport system permease protein